MKASSLPLLASLSVLGLLAQPAAAQPAAVPPDAAPPAVVPPAVVPPAAVPPAVADPAVAAPPAPSPEEAVILQQQVRAWLIDITAGVIPISDSLVRFTPDGDGYRITVPVGTLAEVEPKDAAITGHVHRLDATRWSIDDQQIPPSLKITTHQRLPDAGDDLPTRGETRHTHLETVIYEVKLGQQTSTGVFDPTYTTPANSQGSVSSLDMVQTGGPAATIMHVGPGHSVSSLTPAGAGRIDMLVDSTMENYATKTALPGGPSLTMTIERVHVMAGISGFAHEKLAPLFRTIVAAEKLTSAADAPITVAPPAPKPGATRPGAKPPAKPAAPRAPAVTAPSSDAQAKAAAHAMLVAAAGLLTGGKLDETADGLAFEFSGHDGKLAHLAISFAGDAPADMLTASMGLTLDGLTIAELPPAMAAYVPSHFTIHPTLSNLSVAALTKIGMDASAPGSSDKAADADLAALFQHGGINFGFDTLGLDVGETKLSGSGSFNMAGPETVTGQAELSARGLDALLTRVQADPTLAQAVPIIIFLKGIAKVNGDDAVWQVSLANGKALVNGVDLMAMAGAMSH